MFDPKYAPENIIWSGKRVRDMSREDLIHFIGELDDHVARLGRLINTPHTDDWFQAVRFEAAHQIERWGVEHDRGKGPPEWFWLIGYLAGKAVTAALKGDTEKALHHTISTGAVLLNWWRRMKGVEFTYQPASDDAVRMIEDV